MGLFHIGLGYGVLSHRILYGQQHNTVNIAVSSRKD